MDKLKETKAKKNKKGKVKVFTKKKKTPVPEDILIGKLKSQYESIDTTTLTKFTDLPLSHKTIKGLKESKYYNLTDIQKESIGLALKGNDVLGAAQTGSGKTLAFLVPILERLYCEKWTRFDGIGALVITPTRELAYQIFETLRKIGKYQDFSAGLIIGGKDLKFERRRMDQCNIVICTPGRLLQHMDENPLFDCVNMRTLVLDEADRCLDMGFKQTMNAIIANLPVTRQTLLFSATQTKSVQDLARLSLKDPSYISVHEMTTPKELQQSYVVCELQDKVANLWSFIRNHLKQKTIIFFSTCKQVKYFYEMFCKLRPGLSLLPLYGTLHQLRRMKIYEEFCRKQSAVLFATDLAARGLDFPEVHWVVQADCPEDVETYIHRVGRTARYHKGGESLLLLMPSELKMVEHLEEKKIPIEKIDINPIKLQNPVRKMEALLVKDLTLKDTAQRAVSHYARAIYFMKHKEIFDVQALDFDSFSKSIGLNVPPRIRFLARMNKKQQITDNEVSKKSQSAEINDNNNRKVYFDDDNEEDSGCDSGNIKETTQKNIKHKEKRSSEGGNNLKFDYDDGKAFKQPKHSSLNFEISDSDSEDDLLQAKRKDHDIVMPENMEPIETFLGQNKKKKPITKAAVVKKMLKKNIVPNKKILFDDDGGALVQGAKERKSDLAKEFDNEDAGGIDIEKAKLVLREEDKFDKQMFKAKVKAKHKEERRKLKEQKRLEAEGEKDDFGESESDEGPDLSWLPDPDQIYGEKEGEDDEDAIEDSVKSNVSNKGEEIANKRKEKKGKKRKGMDNLETVLKRKRKQRIEHLSADLNVNETEELALMLLKKK